MTDSITSSRRKFIKSSAAIAGSLAMSCTTSTQANTSSVHAGVDETLRIGLIGCGGRGTGAAMDALSADANAKLVAIGDAFIDAESKI